MVIRILGIYYVKYYFVSFKVLWGQERLSNQEKTALPIFKVDSTSGPTVTAQQEEKEDDMSVQESYTAKILRIAEDSKQNKSAFRPLTHACPKVVLWLMVCLVMQSILWQKTGVIILWIPLLLRCVWYWKKYNEDLWNSETIDDIINDEEGDAPAPVVGDKRQHVDDDDEDDDSGIDDDYS